MDRRTITEDAQVNYLNFYPYFRSGAPAAPGRILPARKQEPAKGNLHPRKP